MHPSTRQRLTSLLLRLAPNSRLQLGPEVTNQALQRPSKRLAQCTNRMALDLLRQLLQHIDLSFPAEALLEAMHDLVGPLGALATRGALATGLMVVELGKAGNGAHDIGRLVHDDDGGGAQAGLRVLEGVEVHELVIAGGLGQDGRGGAAGDDGLQVVPAAAHAAAVLVDELAQRDRHLLLDGARVVDVTRDAEELGAGVALAPERVEPRRAPPADGRRDRDRFHVGHGRGTAEEADGGGEGRLQPWLARLALERLDERRFLAAHVGAHAAVDEDVEVVARAARVLADEPGLVGFLDGALEDGGFVVELAADVDVGGAAVHGPAGDETAFDEFVRVLAHDFAVFAGAGLAFVGVDDEVAGLGVLVPVFEVHEGLGAVSTECWMRWWSRRTHFMPEGKPAPPRPRRPDALISEMICSHNVKFRYKDHPLQY